MISRRKYANNGGVTEVELKINLIMNFIIVYGKAAGTQQHSPFPAHSLCFSSSVFRKTKAVLTTKLKTSKTYNFREA